MILLAFLVRLIIPTVLPTASSNLQGAVELSTLVSSFTSLKEGVFLYSNNISIYDGGVVHHSPLLILLMDSFIESAGLLYPLIDAVTAYYIIQIAKTLDLKSTQNRKNKLSPEIIGLVFALNPISILSNIGKSTVSFNNLFIASAFHYGLIGNSTLSAISISIAAYLSYTPIYLVFPLLKVTYESKRSMANFILVTLSTIGSLIGFSYVLTGNSWKFIDSTYGVIIMFDKIEPNLGLWWYYFTEMFDFFIPFYIAVFNIYYVSLIMPLSLRLNGTFAYILTIGWLNFTKPYPELGDLSLYLTLLLLLQPVFKYLSYFIISTLLLLVSIVLAPIFYHLWIDLGSGNSNFFYAITLSYSLGIASTVADFAWGYLVQEYHELNQDKNVNKKITQI